MEALLEQIMKVSMDIKHRSRFTIEEEYEEDYDLQQGFDKSNRSIVNWSCPIKCLPASN
jgi:hypothetical protein